jgi:hypothetical protein
MRLPSMALQAAECDALRAQLAVTSQRMEEKAAAEGEIMVRDENWTIRTALRLESRCDPHQHVCANTSAMQNSLVKQLGKLREGGYMLAKTLPLRRRAPRGIYENSAPNGELPVSSALHLYAWGAA